MLGFKPWHLCAVIHGFRMLLSLLVLYFPVNKEGIDDTIALRTEEDNKYCFLLV